MSKPEGLNSAEQGYGHAYRQRRLDVLRPGALCWRCGMPADQADHVPPIALVRALNPGWTRRQAAESALVTLRPICATCNRTSGRAIRRALRNPPHHVDYLRRLLAATTHPTASGLPIPRPTSPPPGVSRAW